MSAGVGVGGVWLWLLMKSVCECVDEKCVFVLKVC